MSTCRPKSFSVDLKLDLQFWPKFTHQKCFSTLKKSTLHVLHKISGIVMWTQNIVCTSRQILAQIGVCKKNHFEKIMIIFAKEPRVKIGFLKVYRMCPIYWCVFNLVASSYWQTNIRDLKAENIILILEKSSTTSSTTSTATRSRHCYFICLFSFSFVFLFMILKTKNTTGP
jgi:hypothetical protein